MSHDYSLCHKSAVYVPIVQFMSQESSLRPHNTVLSQEYSLFPKSTVHFPWLQFMSLE